MWYFYALLSALFAALTAIFAKVGVSNVNSDLATAIRTIVILIMVWVIVFYKKADLGFHNISGKSLLFLIISGIATGLSWMFYFRALQMGKASQVAAVDKLSIVFVFVLALLFLKEPFNVKHLAGVVLIAIGAMMMIK